MRQTLFAIGQCKKEYCMSAEIESIVVELSELKRQHHYCDDSWYSCPMEESGCINEDEPKKCNCGADDHNTKIDLLIGRVRALKLAETAQQPNNTQSAGETPQICAHYERQSPCAWVKGETCGNFGACQMQRKLRAL